MPLTHDEHAELQRLLAKANEMPPVPSDVLEELAEYDADTGLFVNPITGDVSDVWDCDFSASHGAMTDGSKRREDEMCQPVSKRMMFPKAKVVPKPHHAGEPSLPAYAPVGVCVEAPFPQMGAEQGFEPVALPAFPEGITDVKTWGMTVIAFGQFKDKEMSYEEFVQSEESRCVSYVKWCRSRTNCAQGQLKDLCHFLLHRFHDDAATGFQIPGTNQSRRFKK